LGHEAQEIITNDDRLQMKWAQENGIRTLSSSRYLNYGLKLLMDYNWRYKIIKAQVKQIRLDVLYIQEGNILSDAFIAKLKPLIKLIVGQVASSIPSQRTYMSYDLVLTSFPHFVERFRKRGIASEYFRLAFDVRVLNEIDLINPKFDVTFVGGISKAHRQGYELLKEVREQLSLDLFGYGKETLDPSSLAYQHHRGEVWGLDMYRILAQSRITLNRHIDVAKNYANNMRLFEATGMGACLITDWKENPHEMFVLEKEVVTYRSADELVEKVNYLFGR
jgi:spore maturation protein CgeB